MPAPGDRSRDILTVASFIGWHDPAHLQGGRRASEALAAFSRLVGIDAVKLMAIIKGEEASDV